MDSADPTARVRLMNRFEHLLASTQMGEWFALRAEDIGMDAQEFHQFVDTIISVAQPAFIASNAHRERDARRWYDAVLIMRTS